MAILFIFMILIWAILAFVPAWIDMKQAFSSDSEENISDRKPFIVPTFTDGAMSLEGPATATIFEAAKLKAEQALVAKNGDTPRVQHISVAPRNVESRKYHDQVTIIDRDYVLRSGSKFVGNISVKGTVRIEQDASLEGSITSTKAVIVSQDARVFGDIDAQADIRIESGAKVSGSLFTETDIWIYENARVGSGDTPVTVRANEVIVAPTARIHGAIWARKDGVHFPRTQAA